MPMPRREVRFIENEIADMNDTLPACNICTRERVSRLRRVWTLYCGVGEFFAMALAARFAAESALLLGEPETTPMRTAWHVLYSRVWRGRWRPVWFRSAACAPSARRTRRGLKLGKLDWFSLGDECHLLRCLTTDSPKADSRCGRELSHDGDRSRARHCKELREQAFCGC